MLRRDAVTKSDEYPEEVLGGAGVDCAVLNLGLFSEIFGGFDGRLHALDGEEGGEVCCVRRDDDERKEPPDLAVYEEMMMSVKNHQTLPTIRPDIDLHSTNYITLNKAQIRAIVRRSGVKTTSKSKILREHRNCMAALTPFL